MNKVLKSKFFHIFMAITASLVMSSCGEYGGGPAPISSARVGSIIEVQPSLDELSLSNARSACSRLRAMRMNLASTDDISSIKFDVRFGSCNGNPDVMSARATVDSVFNNQITLSVTTLSQYDIPGKLLEESVNTDENGIMQQFCQAFFNNGDPNQVYSNFLGLGVVYAFPNSNTIVRSVVTKNTTNETILSQKKTYTVEANSAATRNAMIEKIEYETQCSNGNVKYDYQNIEEYSLK
ncbi:hypothetical protein ABMA77_13385 [Halobacteriovorax sp. RZ-1]|uniref:hypothetical protein n=1 Tax=unclassified Halobacteriovorax TaxID=2639665 RepID=UPI0037126901